MNDKKFDLHHPAGITISPSLTESELAGINCLRKDMGTGWVWYRLPTFQDGEIIVGIALGFQTGKLVQLSISDANPKFGDNWSTSSEHQERLRAQSIRAWLVAQGLVPGTYAWGSVWADYDPKGGFGSAAIRFVID